MQVKWDKLGCKFGRHNYWYSQGAFRCKACGHVTYGSPPKGKKMVILIPIIIVVAVAGYWTYHNYAPQMIQNEASKVINNTGSTIQQISSQSQQSFSNLQNSATLTTNGDNRVPIAVYDNCNSLVRADNMRDIGTDCGGKSFRFNMPDILQQSLQGQELVGVKTKVYQYGTNDFKIGLYDQLGEKNYTVTLWQLP